MKPLFEVELRPSRYSLAIFIKISTGKSSLISTLFSHSALRTEYVFALSHSAR
jgi:hypothetical protein